MELTDEEIKKWKEKCISSQLDVNSSRENFETAGFVLRLITELERLRKPPKERLIARPTFWHDKEWYQIVFWFKGDMDELFDNIESTSGLFDSFVVAKDNEQTNQMNGENERLRKPFSVVVGGKVVGEIPETRENGQCSFKCRFHNPEKITWCKIELGQTWESSVGPLHKPGPNCPRYKEKK